MSAHPLEDRLARIRWRVRRVLCLYGLGWLAAVVVGLVLVAGWGDWLFHFDDRGVRFILLAGILAAAGWVAYRYLITPLSVPFRNLDLAMRIEDRYPGLKDSLVSTVDFLERGGNDPRVGSPVMQQAVIEQTLERVDRLDFDSTIQTRPLRKVALAVGSVTLLAAIVVFTHQADARLAARRLFWPWDAPAWPRQTNLRLLHADFSPLPEAPRPTSANAEPEPAPAIKLAKGDQFEFLAENMTGALPPRVTLEYRPLATPNARPTQETLRPASMRDKSGKVREVAAGVLPSHKGSLEFRVVGGDDTNSRWRTVNVIPPPLVEDLQVTLTPPKYMKREVERLPSGVGHLQGYLGTRVDIVAHINKPVQAATVRVKAQAMPATKLSADGRQMEASFTIGEPGTYSYRIELKDLEGFEGGEPPRYEIQGLQDAVPDVVIDLPSSDLQVTTDAEVKVKVTAKDDLGLKGMRLVYHVADPAAPVADEPAAGVAPQAIPLFSGEGRPLQQVAELAWKLENLKLTPGMRVVFHAEAGDDYDLGPEHVGRSISRTLIVVSPQEKARELAQRQANLLEELQRTTKLQKETRQQTTELLLQLKKVGKLQPTDIDVLQRADMAQRQIASQLNNPSDGLENTAQEILKDLEANNLKNEKELKNRAERIANELRRLGEGPLPVIEQELTQARKLAEAVARGDVTPPEPKSETGKPEPGKSEPSKGRPSNGKSNEKESPQKSGAEKSAPSKDGKPTGDSSSTDPKSNPTGSELTKHEPPTAGSDGKSAPPQKKPSDGKAADTKAGKTKAGDSKSGDTKAGSESPSGEEPDAGNSPESAGDNSTPQDKSSAGKSTPQKSGAEKSAAVKSTPQKSGNQKSGDQKPSPQKAGSDKPESKPESTSDTPQTALERVDENQREVADTLGELTQELSEWRSERDTAEELDEMLDNQKKLNKQTGELGQKTLTKGRDELTPQEQADLAKLAERQRKQSEKLEQLEGKMQKQSDDMQERNPTASATLRNAVEESRQAATSGKMREASEQIKENRLGSAGQSQEQILRKLSEMKESLENRRTGDTETLVKSLKQSEQELNSLRKKQQELQALTKQAQQNPDAGARQKELERLGKEQAKLREQAKQLARQLQRLRVRKGSEAARRASQKMDQAQQQMDENPEESAKQQEESLDDLEQAQREMAKARREAEEQLAQEQLEKIAPQLQAMADLQQKRLEETRRLEGLRTPEGTLKRSQLSSLSALREDQQNLRQETLRLAEKLSAAEAFGLALKGAARQMQRATEFLEKRLTNEPTQKAQLAAKQRFLDLLAALNPEKKPGAGQQQQKQQKQDGDQGGGAQPQGEGISGLAQLMLLKTLQQELLDRTAELQGKRSEQQGTLTPEQQQELDEIAREQGQIADLARNLMQQALDNSSDDEEEPAADTKPAVKKPREETKPAAKKSAPKTEKSAE